jgi:hypothetical protein
MVWMGALVANLEPAAAVGNPTVRVFIYDYARISPALLKGAMAAASGIVERAGVDLEWTECAVRAEETPKDSPCHRIMLVDIQLRILPADMAKRAGTRPHCLGYAITKSGSVAAVYHHRAIELMKEGLASLRLILGAATAHEIGHLLLAESSHSPAGLMRAAWDKEDLRALMRGSLSFSDAQAQRMASMAARRVEVRANAELYSDRP